MNCRSRRTGQPNDEGSKIAAFHSCMGRDSWRADFGRIPWHSLELRQAHPWLLSAHTKWWSERGSWHVPLVAVQWGWMRHMWSLRNAAMQLCRRWSIRDHGLCTGLSSAVWHWDMKMLYYLTVMQLGCVHKPSKGKNNAMQCKYYS